MRPAPVVTAPAPPRRESRPHAPPPEDARALQRRLAHAYHRGAAEEPAIRPWPPAARTALLLGATGSLWWGVFAIARLAMA